MSAGDRQRHGPCVRGPRPGALCCLQPFIPPSPTAPAPSCRRRALGGLGAWKHGALSENRFACAFDLVLMAGLLEAWEGIVCALGVEQRIQLGLAVRPRAGLVCPGWGGRAGGHLSLRLLCAGVVPRTTPVGQSDWIIMGSGFKTLCALLRFVHLPAVRISVCGCSEFLLFRARAGGPCPCAFRCLSMQLTSAISAIVSLAAREKCSAR